MDADRDSFRNNQERKEIGNKQTESRGDVIAAGTYIQTLWLSPS